MKAVVNNLAIEYQDEGEGPLLLLMHGWGSSLKVFDALSRVLRSRYRVIRLDFPGFGASERPKDDWYVGDYAQFTAKFLQKVAKTQVPYAVIGHSFGARVIIKALSGRLVHSQKVVLIGAAGIKPRITVRQQAMKLLVVPGRVVQATPGLRRVATPLRRRLYDKLGSTDYLRAGTMRQIFLHTITEDLREDMRRNMVPTLLIWGDQDTETPIWQGREMDSLMPNAKLMIVTGAGHYVFLDQPQESLRLITEFLNDKKIV